jgi:alkanesulfonate monooxygenase SsuD/methylene tetrahydromethanopterin reductase-like flavin-dependent oxidoreductase (luciferase family)
MTELAPAAEQLGFESLWVAEHTHIPTSRETPWPGGAELPKHYWHTLDPFIALTAAALASKTIRVATGICLLTERDPIHAAKQAASVDVVSNGRLIFGIGAGWNREEMANHGTEFKTRWKLMRERAERSRRSDRRSRRVPRRHGRLRPVWARSEAATLRSCWEGGPKIPELGHPGRRDGWMPNWATLARTRAA